MRNPIWAFGIYTTLCLSPSPFSKQTHCSKILTNELSLIQVKLGISEQVAYLGVLKVPHRDPRLSYPGCHQGLYEGRAKDFQLESNYEVTLESGAYQKHNEQCSKFIFCFVGYKCIQVHTINARNIIKVTKTPDYLHCFLIKYTGNPYFILDKLKSKNKEKTNIIPPPRDIPPLIIFCCI